jgi:hypothetical protein
MTPCHLPAVPHSDHSQLQHQLSVRCTLRRFSLHTNPIVNAPCKPAGHAIAPARLPRKLGSLQPSQTLQASAGPHSVSRLSKSSHPRCMSPGLRSVYAVWLCIMLGYLVRTDLYVLLCIHSRRTGAQLCIPPIAISAPDC